MSEQEVAALIQTPKEYDQTFNQEPLKCRFKFQRVEDITYEPDDDQWLIEGIIPKQGVIIVYGKTQSNKTFILVDMSISVAAGDECWGHFPINNPSGGICVYVAAEGAGGLNKRLAGIKANRNEKLVNFSLLADRPILGASNNSDTKALIAEMKALGKISLVIIDTLSQVLGGADENGSGMQAVLAAATDISNQFKCAVVLIHHPGHHGKDPRGHSSAMGNADTLLQFESDKPLSSIITIKKQKDGESGQAFCVKLKLQSLGQTKAGKPVNTLVVDKITTAPAKSLSQSTKLTPDEQSLMSAYRQACDKHPETIPTAGASKSVQAVKLENLRKEFYSLNPHKKEAAKRQSLTRLPKALVKKGMLLKTEHQGQTYYFTRKEEFSSVKG